MSQLLPITQMSCREIGAVRSKDHVRDRETPMHNPSHLDIDHWSLMNLVMECTAILHPDDEEDLGPDENYMTMSDEQRAAKGWPVTLEEMREFIKANQESV